MEHIVKLICPSCRGVLSLSVMFSHDKPITCPDCGKVFMIYCPMRFRALYIAILLIFETVISCILDRCNITLEIGDTYGIFSSILYIVIDVATLQFGDVLIHNSHYKYYKWMRK